MKISSIASRLGAVACLLASSPAVALTISYCSKENTASSDTLVSSIYQSNGRCQTTCNADYAFAVVQDKNCWCTNYVPAAQASVSDCDKPCPGYPDDLCGNSDKGLYGYIAMANVQPSGTSGGGGANSATGTSSGSITTTQSAPQTETITVTASNLVSSTLKTSVVSPGSSASSTSSGDSSTTTTAPIVSVHTVAGQPVTVTVGNPAPAQTSGGSASTDHKSSSLSGGAIAGIVIGCLVGVGALAAAGLWFFFFGRRRNEENEKSPSPDPSTPGTASDAQRQSRGSQMTFMRGFMGSSEPSSATSPNNDFLNPNRAYTDNRMKKDAALYPNGGRHSAVSLRDDEDYSRPVLRLTNPD